MALARKSDSQCAAPVVCVNAEGYVNNSAPSNKECKLLSQGHYVVILSSAHYNQVVGICHGLPIVTCFGERQGGFGKPKVVADLKADDPDGSVG